MNVLLFAAVSVTFVTPVLPFSIGVIVMVSPVGKVNTLPPAGHMAAGEENFNSVIVKDVKDGCKSIHLFA